MLDAHPELSIPPETHFHVIFTDVADAANAGRDVRDTLFKAIVNSPRWPDFHLDRDALHKRIENLGDTFTLADGVRAFYRLYAEKRGKYRWGDKTPGYTNRIAEIARLLPEARFIHIIRDGRDVASSMRHLWFGPRDNIETLAREWVKQISNARSAAIAIADRYIEIRYEDLVADPEQILHKACAFIGLKFDAGMLRYQEAAAKRLAELQDLGAGDGRVMAYRRTRIDMHRRVFETPNSAQVGRWHRDMTPADVATFESIAGKILVTNGYGLAAEAELRRALE